MADKFFVDTNILLYAHDRSAGVKHERARQLLERLWTSGEGVLSTQVLQELCINLRRKIARPLPVEEIRQIIQDYLSWEVVDQYSALDRARAGDRSPLPNILLGRSCPARGGKRGSCGCLFRGFVSRPEVRRGSGGQSAALNLLFPDLILKVARSAIQVSVYSLPISLGREPALPTAIYTDMP